MCVCYTVSTNHHFISKLNLDPAALKQCVKQGWGMVTE